MTVHDRLRDARADAGFKTAAEAARHFGWKGPTYYAHENGGRDPGKSLAEYARAFGVYYDWLKTGRGPQKISTAPPGAAQPNRADLFLTPAKVDYIPVLGVVEAGAFREMTEDFDGETVAYIPYSPDKKVEHLPHFAHVARGDSMNAGTPAITDGTIVISVDWAASGLEPRNGMYVIVERMNFGGHLREITVKEIEVVSGGFNLVPRSTNPKHKKIFVPKGDFDDGTEVRIIGKVVKIQSDVP